MEASDDHPKHRVRFVKLNGKTRGGGCPVGEITLNGTRIGLWEPDTQDEARLGHGAMHRVYGYSAYLDRDPVTLAHLDESIEFHLLRPGVVANEDGSHHTLAVTGRSESTRAILRQIVASYVHEQLTNRSKA